MAVDGRLSRSLSLRQVTEADEDLLRRVYASTRAAELSLAGWDEPTMQAFVRQQFDAQQAWYQRANPDGIRQVILVGGQAAGRLYLDERPAETRIVDIAVLPEFQGQGAGSTLLATILDHAARRGASVSLHVEGHNPALGWYLRRGFTVEEDQGAYLLLRWRGPAHGPVPAP